MKTITHTYQRLRRVCTITWCGYTLNISQREGLSNTYRVTINWLHGTQAEGQSFSTDIAPQQCSPHILSRRISKQKVSTEYRGRAELDRGYDAEQRCLLSPVPNAMWMSRIPLHATKQAF